MADLLSRDIEADLGHGVRVVRALFHPEVPRIVVLVLMADDGEIRSRFDLDKRAFMDPDARDRFHDLDMEPFSRQVSALVPRRR